MKHCYKIKQKVSEKSYLMYPFEGGDQNGCIFG